jgi:flagellar hook-associated protein 3 FlgL
VRITNDTLRQVFLSALETAQRQVQETQTQVSTGLRVNRPSDDPLASARIRELEASVARLDQYQANGIIARNRLGLEEEVIADVVQNLQRVRELAVQANNATQSVENRRAIAVELRERLDGLIGLANSADSAGRYLFAGFAENTLPFVRSGGSVTYNGDQGQRSLQISDGRLVAVSDPGSEVFQRIANGNGTFTLSAGQANVGSGVLGAGSVLDPAAYVPDTYTVTFLSPSDYEVRDGGGGLLAAGTYADGEAIGFLGIEIQLSGQPAAGDAFTAAPSTTQDLFATVDKLIIALENGNGTEASRALVHNQIGQSLVDLDQAVGRLLEVRAEIGGRLRAVEEEAGLNEGFALQFTDTLSDIRDLDYAEAISLLSQQLLGLEAAQQTYVRVQGLTLFRFL